MQNNKIFGQNSNYFIRLVDLIGYTTRMILKKRMVESTSF